MTDPYDPFDVRCSIDSIQSVVVRAENGEDWPTRVADLCKSCRALVMRLTLTEAYLRSAEKRAVFFEAHAPRTLEGDGSDLPFGSVVIDNVGDVWQRDGDGRWSPADIPSTAADYLGDAYAPYTIVYTPTPEENTNE